MAKLHLNLEKMILCQGNHHKTSQSLQYSKVISEVLVSLKQHKPTAAHSAVGLYAQPFTGWSGHDAGGAIAWCGQGKKAGKCIIRVRSERPTRTPGSVVQGLLTARGDRERRSSPLRCLGPRGHRTHSSADAGSVAV